MLFDRPEPPAPARSAAGPSNRERAMWMHFCVAEKINLFTARGEPCNWCGAREGR